jgi:hypothetical protein
MVRFKGSLKKEVSYAAEHCLEDVGVSFDLSLFFSRLRTTPTLFAFKWCAKPAGYLNPFLANSEWRGGFL